MLIGISGGQKYCIAYARFRCAKIRNPFNIRAENRRIVVKIRRNSEKY